MAKVDEKILNQLAEVISSVAALDFTKKIEGTKGDGTALDTIAIGLNMLSEELEGSVVSIEVLQDKNIELQDAILKMNEFNHALNSSSIVVVTDFKGDIIHVNDKFCEISKFTEEEVLGQNQRIVNSGYYPKEFRFKFWRTILKGKVFKDEFKNRAKDGSIYWMNITIVPFIEAHGKPYKFMAIGSDITEQKLLDQQLLNSIISNQENDREVFAEDLHEGIAQSLAALMLQIGVIELKVRDNKDPQLQESIDFIKTYILESIENTRVMATGLMPRMMMQYGIEPSLRSYISNIQKDGIRFIQFSCTISSKIEKDIEITLYRVIVSLIDKVSVNIVNSIFISISSCDSQGLILAVNVKCCSENINACTLETIDFEDNRKRIESLGGHFRLLRQKGSLKLKIKFV
ncbi:MAG: two-component system sensor histidine kinase NreB [Flavobacteriales bacterium]|jgi:two-component system sensor histidine kinase NreB|tara:strand:- start:16550 stop:17758 length:1209 start_codon:yes stop_codon:yes gene_type:complete